MLEPQSDKDQLRYAQIRSRMITGLARHLPEPFMESAGAKTRAELMIRLCESENIVAIVETCAYVAQMMEKERSQVRR